MPLTTPRRPRRHWKHSRFVATDDFVWAKPTLFEGRMYLPHEPVDKKALGEVKLRRFFKAKRIEANYQPPVPKDPMAPAKKGGRRQAA